jgi:hypothetical protein
MMTLALPGPYFVACSFAHSVSHGLDAANCFHDQFSVLSPGLLLHHTCLCDNARCNSVLRDDPAEYPSLQQTRTGARLSRISLDAGPYSFCLILKLNYRMFTRAHELPLQLKASRTHSLRAL